MGENSPKIFLFYTLFFIHMLTEQIVKTHGTSFFICLLTIIMFFAIFAFLTFEQKNCLAYTVCLLLSCALNRICGN
uniref:Uncharacterized protein n=1 Tax=Anguilla anguilla TaxID=7936 RepID=A0A0E9XEL0_ANGAN